MYNQNIGFWCEVVWKNETVFDKITSQLALKKAKGQLLAVSKNLVDEARVELKDPPPDRPHNDIIYLPVNYTGNL